MFLSLAFFFSWSWFMLVDIPFMLSFYPPSFFITPLCHLMDTYRWPSALPLPLACYPNPAHFLPLCRDLVGACCTSRIFILFPTKPCQCSSGGPEEPLPGHFLASIHGPSNCRTSKDDIELIPERRSLRTVGGLHSQIFGFTSVYEIRSWSVSARCRKEKPIT